MQHLENKSKVCHATHGVENWRDADHVQTLKFANTHAVSLRNCKKGSSVYQHVETDCRGEIKHAEQSIIMDSEVKLLQA